MATISTAVARFRLVFNVPLSALESCKSAIFAAGAGRYPGPGEYTECCWIVVGTGQFRPGGTSRDALCWRRRGKEGSRCTEIVCSCPASVTITLAYGCSAGRIRTKNPRIACIGWRISDRAAQGEGFRHFGCRSFGGSLPT